MCHTSAFKERKLQCVVTQPVPGVAVGLRKIRQASTDRLLVLFSCIMVVNLGSMPLDYSGNSVTFIRLTSENGVVGLLASTQVLTNVLFLLFAFLL